MLALLYFLGLAAVVLGLALESVPLALVVGGVLVSATAIGLARGQAKLAAVAAARAAREALEARGGDG